MQLTAAHLRYLLAIYEVSRTHLDISSRSIAEKLGVTKPSVVRILNLLMEQGMIVKEYYGKIYLTDRGIWVAKRVQQELDAILAHFPPVSGELTDEEHDVFRRGRNANVHSIPHHADRADYQKATGLEALFGWLYLRDDHARINELFNRMMEDDNAT